MYLGLTVVFPLLFLSIYFILTVLHYWKSEKNWINLIFFTGAKWVYVLKWWYICSEISFYYVRVRIPRECWPKWHWSMRFYVRAHHVVELIQSLQALNKQNRIRVRYLHWHFHVECIVVTSYRVDKADSMEEISYWKADNLSSDQEMFSLIYLILFSHTLYHYTLLLEDHV